MEEKIIVKLEAEISDLKSQLGAAQAEIKRFGLGVETSINAITLDRLNSQLKQLQTQLGATDVGSTAFKNIGLQITAVEGQINSALTSIGQNASRSSSKFNGLNNSINQLTRELPAFGLSANIGFLAISNNLPILFDEIKKVRDANKELAATGVATTSVFKSLTAALFSWQTALSIGVTLLTVYGGKIIDLLSNLNKVKEGFNATKAELDGLDSAFKSPALGNAIGEVVLLKSSLETAGKSIQGQKQFVDQYNKTIGTVTGSVKSFSEAEAGVIAGTDAYINAMVNRAIAIKFADEAGQILLEKEGIRAKQGIRIKQNANAYLLKAEEDYANNTNPEETKISGLYYYGQKREDYLKQSIEWQIAQQVEADKKEIDSVDNKYKTFTQLSKAYYKKAGLITTEDKNKTEQDRNIPDMAKMSGASSQMEDAKKLFSFYKQQGPESLNVLGEAYANNPFFKALVDGELDNKTLKLREDIDKLGQSPTWTDEEMVQYIDNLENIANLVSGVMTSAFDAALISGQNFFKVMWKGLLNLINKLLVAIAAAALLSLILGAFGGASSVTGFVPIFKKLSGFNLEGINPQVKPVERVATPSGTAQGNVSFEIQGDKLYGVLQNYNGRLSRLV